MLARPLLGLKFEVVQGEAREERRRGGPSRSRNLPGQTCDRNRLQRLKARIRVLIYTRMVPAAKGSSFRQSESCRQLQDMGSQRYRRPRLRKTSDALADLADQLRINS
jgi:hypothetical protein